MPYQVVITSSSGNQGVGLATATPMSVGDIGSGDTQPVTLKYNIPNGVHNFKATTLGATPDACGQSFNYPI